MGLTSQTRQVTSVLQRCSTVGVVHGTVQFSTVKRWQRCTVEMPRTVNGAGWCTLPSTVQTLLQFFHRYWHFQRCSSTVPRPAKKIHTWHSRLLPFTPLLN